MKFFSIVVVLASLAVSMNQVAADCRGDCAAAETACVASKQGFVQCFNAAQACRSRCGWLFKWAAARLDSMRTEGVFVRFLSPVGIHTAASIHEE
jgi:hypothetical protein